MYNAYVTKIKDIRKHSNADRLQVGYCFGNQIIVSLETQEGDMGVYFPTDGRLGMEFCIANNLLRIKNADGTQGGGYLEPEKRHVSSLKLRGEISDGLFMPLTCLEKFTDISKLNDGDLISILNGITICEKYIPNIKCKGASGSANVGKSKKKKKQFIYFEEHIDTTQLAYNRHQFKVGDICYITLKMHGTSGRTSYTIEESELKKTLIDKFLRRDAKIVRKWNVATGTRRVVLDFEKDNQGFYNDDSFRRKWHDIIAPKLQKGETVYYEIVGFTSKDSLIMPQCKNKLTNDKEFIKQYGETTTFTYGCENGQNDVYIYRMTLTNEDGYTIEYPQEFVALRCEQMGLKMVPELDRFIYTTDEDLTERVERLCDGIDPIGQSHIREGVVVRIEGKEKFKAFKHKNIWFKILEGLIKADDILDMEDAQESE